MSALVLGLIIIIFSLFLWETKTKERKHEPDYRGMFFIGIIFIALGIIFESTIFFILGIVFFVTGGANKERWGKDIKRSPQADKWIILGITILVVLLAIVALVFILN